MAIAIVADSSNALPPQVNARYRISVVPLSFIVDGEQWLDGEIKGAEFYDRLQLAHEASSAAPAPGAFLEAIRRAQEAAAEGVLCLTLSSEYSGTHGSALNAAEMATHEWPDLPVRVIDTRSMAMAYGFCVLAAARAACAGATLEEAAAVAEAVSRRVYMGGVLETMRYLAKSGRVPWIVHWAASLLHIKPVLAVSGGRIRAVGRVRTMGNAIERLVRYVEERAQPGTPLHVGVMHAHAAERATELARIVVERVSPAELFVTEVTSAMSVHTGPGFLGLAFYSDE